jgi:tetratricopeptide (TPR) repeat protein
MAFASLLSMTARTADAGREVPERDIPLANSYGIASQDLSESQRLLAERKWPEAIIILRSILTRGAAPLSVTLDLARALFYSGRREEAISVLTQSISLEKKDASVTEILERRSRVLARTFLSNEVFQIYQEGLNLIRLEKVHQARERFEKALESEPDNAEILLRLGQSLVLDEDYDSASERLRLAKRLDPKEPEIDLWLGRALYKRGEQKDGLLLLRRGFRNLEKSERAVLWLAEALSSSEQKNAALQLLEKDVRSYPFHLQAMLALVRLRVKLAGDSGQNLWSARRELQLILSRLQRFSEGVSNGEPVTIEGPLGLDWAFSVDRIKEDASKLFAQIEARLKNLENSQ